MSQHLKTLIAKLHPVCRQAAERAASICMNQGHFEVDLEHLLLGLMEQPQGDLVLLCHRHDIDPQRLSQDLERAMHALRQGNTRTPVFSQNLMQWLEHAWLIASLDGLEPRVRSGHLLLALLNTPALAQQAQAMSPLFARFRIEDIKHRLDALTQGSLETPPPGEGAAASAGPEAGGETPASALPASTQALDRYTTNLTQRAREGAIDPVIGREPEIRQLVDILMRRRQNNPILTGEAGVGKTAVVEGLAQRIASGEVPPPLQGVALHVLDLGLLQAGASVKGEFENRLKQVINEVKASPHPIVLFIDEAHTLIGAGGQAGQNDAANLLKPALARGELRTIAATTWSEYKKYFEKDAALARRFQVVKVEEPSEPLAAAMLRAMVPLMEQHFGVRVLDEAIEDAVRLSARYISGRQLPDKAVGVLDTACAKVALGGHARPAPLEMVERDLRHLDGAIAALERELAAGAPHQDRLQQLRAEREALQAREAQLRARLEQEQALVQQIQALRRQLEDEKAAEPAPLAEPAAEPSSGRRRRGAAQAALTPAQAELQALQQQLDTLQGDEPLLPLQVDRRVVADIVSGWTGIPLGRMIKDELQAVMQLESSLQERVIGQDHALAAIAQRVRTARAQLEDPNKPKGVFLMVGPSGVGKTETALALAETLFGGEKNLITINMSEYQEAHTVSGLKGSPPGYVGYGEGGVLTEAVRRKPYSVVLLDEVEKAHPDVLEMFYQVFDKGWMDDAEGREIDFRNTLILLTSNVGSAQVMQACINKPASERPAVEALEELLRPALYKTFKPAFIGRTKVVPFYGLDDDTLAAVIRLKLQRIAERIQTHHQAEMSFDDALVEAVLARCTEVDTGARNIDHLLNGTLLPALAAQMLGRMAEGKPIQRVKVGVNAKGDFSVKVQ